jgi:crotonobetainyl-CoA:carnitine CoA-transferase CaiB-like acyl-CoA transferase
MGTINSANWFKGRRLMGQVEQDNNLNTEKGPLAGITVVDLSSVVVGPTCTLTLADHGAEVIKVEALEGDLMRTLGGGARNPGMTGKFMNFNRNKRSICINLKTAEGIALLKKILAKADVLVTNMRLGALQKLGLDYASLRETNPQLIYCQILAFGRGGTYFNRPAYDTVIQSSAGVSATFEKSSGEPRFVPLVMGDHITGLVSAQTIGFALYRRTKTMVGELIEIPMFETMAAFVLREHMGNMTFEPGIGPIGDARVLDKNNRPVKTADGYISISPNTDAQAFAFFDAIGRPELKEDPRFNSVTNRTKNSVEYYEIRSGSLGSKTSAQWIEIFERIDIPCMRYNSLEDLLEDPHIQSVNFLQQSNHPTEGLIREIGLTNHFSGGNRQGFTPAPRLGENTFEILQEFGASEEEIEQALSNKSIVQQLHSS